MDPAKYEFQSEFAKRYLSQGRAEGEARGRAETLLKLLTLKFGALDDAAVERIRSASLPELEGWTERVLNAASVEALLK